MQRKVFITHKVKLIAAHQRAAEGFSYASLMESPAHKDKLIAAQREAAQKAQLQSTISLHPLSLTLPLQTAA